MTSRNIWPPMPPLPAEISQQIREILAADLDEEAARRQYPGVFQWVNDNLDIVELVQRSGVVLRPLCAERPDILVGTGCPSCGETIAVKGTANAR